MIPRVKTWVVTVECGIIKRVLIEAPTKRLAILNYRHETMDYRGVILSVGLKKVEKAVDFC